MAKQTSASKQKILRCFILFSSSLIYELVGCCKRYHGASSKPAVRAIAAKVSVKSTPAFEATTPQTALPRASPPCRTSTYIEITRARTQCGAAVCAARFSVARMLIHASPAAAENADATASEGERTSPQSAIAKITVAYATTASGESSRRPALELQRRLARLVQRKPAWRQSLPRRTCWRSAEAMPRTRWRKWKTATCAPARCEYADPAVRNAIRCRLLL